MKSYIEFKNVAKPLSHFERRRPNNIKAYSHHFLVLGISQVKNDIDAITVAHYTSSLEICCGNSSNLGKFERVTFFVNSNSGKSADGDNDLDLFDFNNLYHIDEPNYPQTPSEFQKAFGRLEKRMGEQMYKLSWNNCENAVNFILTGISKSTQVAKSRTFVDMVDAVLIDCKDVGFRTAILVSALAAIAGSLVRRAYVRIIIAAIVSYGAGMALDSNCLKGTGSNLIKEAKDRIMQAEKISDISKIIARSQTSESILDKIQLHMNNSGFICNITEDLAEEARDKTFYASLLVSFGLETVIYMSYICFNLLPLGESLNRIEFTRIIVLHTLAGYVSLFLAAWLGFHGFRTQLRPALSFFVIVLASGLLLRYLFTIIVGIVFDLLTGTCCGCYWPWCRCECDCCNCWSELYKCCRMENTYVRCFWYLILCMSVVICVVYFTFKDYLL